MDNRGLHFIKLFSRNNCYVVVLELLCSYYVKSNSCSECVIDDNKKSKSKIMQFFIHIPISDCNEVKGTSEYSDNITLFLKTTEKDSDD